MTNVFDSIATSNHKKAGLIITLLFFSISLWAQDEGNIADYSDKLLIRLYTNTKTNFVSIQNKADGARLELKPNGTTSLGVGFNYKGFGLGLAFSLPKSSRSNEKYGKTERIDLRGSLYGRKLGGDAYLQQYKGYYNSNPDDFVDWTNDAFPQLGDMEVLSIGLTAFHIFNSKRYSYRAAFVRDEFQNKSAGSFLLGVFGYYDEAATNNGFVPREFPDEFRDVIDIKEFRNLAIGVSVGYAHNFTVGKNWIIGGFILPGFGFQRVAVKDFNETLAEEDQPAAQLLTSLALGYEHEHFFIGLTGSVNFRQIDFGPYDFNLSTEQFRVTVGKRFDLKKNQERD